MDTIKPPNIIKLELSLQAPRTQKAQQTPAQTDSTSSNATDKPETSQQQAPRMARHRPTLAEATLRSQIESANVLDVVSLEAAIKRAGEEIE